MWRDFSDNAPVPAIDFTQESLPDLVTRYVGVLIFMFQPIAKREFPILVEYARNEESHHSIVPKINCQLVIILFEEN